MDDNNRSLAFEFKAPIIPLRTFTLMRFRLRVSLNGIHLEVSADRDVGIAFLPVHPVHKMQKLVLLGGQGGNSGKGGKQRISCIHAYLKLCCLVINDLQKCR